MFYLIPEGWFLWSLRDERTDIVCAGDSHRHKWFTCSLQHETGGKMCTATGRTPFLAITRAVEIAKRQWPDVKPLPSHQKLEPF